MAQQTINIGTLANDRTGDTWRAAMDKTNDNFDELFAIGTPEDQVIINSITDFPTAVAGVITLAAETQYLIGSDVNLGDIRLVMGSNTAVSGIESINVTLTYTGTGDMFTITNVRVRISTLSISCVSGRVINFSDNTDSIFRMNDCSVVCGTFGLFNSTGVNGTTTRFTTVSPSAMTAGGITITGGWNTWLWETSAVNITTGTLFDFGTATFDAIVLDLILAALGAATNLIKGAAASANINVGGTAIITRMLTSGAGTPLNTVTTDDIRWLFDNNDDISDTQPDALIFQDGNATSTVISASSTDGSNAVVLAGTWTEQQASHFTSTAGGIITYTGERDLNSPIDVVASVDPVSDSTLAIYITINGTPVQATGVPRFVKAADNGVMSTIWQEKLSTGDTVEIRIENQTSTANILISDVVCRVR